MNLSDAFLSRRHFFGRTMALGLGAAAFSVRGAFADAASEAA